MNETPGAKIRENFGKSNCPRAWGDRGGGAEAGESGTVFGATPGPFSDCFWVLLE